MRKYRIVKDHPDHPDGTYVLEGDYSFFGGFFGSDWRSVYCYDSLEEAMDAVQTLRQYCKKEKAYKEGTTVVWEE